MITVFGSINVDLVLKTEHLPAPGETVLCPNYEMVAGGKGANQALAAARSGALVRMVGCVGDDSFKSLALKDLNKAGVDLSTVRTTSHARRAAVMVDEAGENAIVVASGANRDATSDVIPNDAFGPSHFLVLQMEIPHEENWLAVDRASSTGTKIVMSVAPAYPVPGRILDAVDYILVNELEGRTIAAASGMGDIPRKNCQNRSPRATIRRIMTLGQLAQSLLIVTTPGTFRHFPSIRSSIRQVLVMRLLAASLRLYPMGKIWKKRCFLPRPALASVVRYRGAAELSNG